MTDKVIPTLDEAVHARQQEAFDKNLDEAFSVTYHECIENFPFWVQNANRRYIHKSIDDVFSGEDKKALRHTTFVEFEFDSKKYRITEESRMGQHDEDDYHVYELYVNEALVFGVSESYATVDGVVQYRVFAVNAFVNEEWVKDFESIKQYYDEKIVEIEDEASESPEAVTELTENFGIDINAIAISPEDKKKPVHAPVSRSPKITNVWMALFLLFLVAALALGLL